MTGLAEAAACVSMLSGIPPFHSLAGTTGTMLLGYNTNGFAHHRLADALVVLAELGYGSVALTLDHDFLDPYAADLDQRVTLVRGLLRRHKLRCVIETGAR